MTTIAVNLVVGMLENHFLGRQISRDTRDTCLRLDLSDRKASLDMVLVAPRNKSVYFEASPVNSLDCCASLLYHEMHRNFTTHHRSQRMHRRVMNLNWELPVMSAAKPWSSQVLHCHTNPRMSQDSKRRRCQLYKDKYRSPATRSLHIHCECRKSTRILWDLCMEF
jgi:hypothetical protein